MKKIYFSLLVLLTCSFGYGQTTVTYDFSSSGAVSGINEVSPGISLDSNIGFGSFKNSGTSNPGIFSNQLRLYQNATKGGSIIIYANNGVTITDVVVNASSRTGDAGYTVDNGSQTNLTGSPTYSINGITATSQVEFFQKEAGSSNRIYVDTFSVTYTSSGGGSCSITDLVLSNVACNDNGTTSDASDDFITFDLNPTGSTLGSSYTISVNSGSVTPTSGTYGSTTSFTLNNGSAGGGDLDVTITDDADNTCTATETITDPGSCSSGGGGSTSTIVKQDFDTNNTWSFSSNVTFFSHKGSNTLNNVYPLPDGWTDDGFLGEIDITNTNSVFSSIGLFSGELLGTSDLDDEGDFGASSATLTFAQQNVSGYTSLEISFDYETVGLDSTDELEYIVIEDGTPGSTVALAKNNSGTEVVTISATNTVQLEIIFTQNGGSDYIGIDNVTLYGTLSSTNDSDSDIVTTSFDPTDNIDYTTYSASNGLTTANAIKVGEFKFVMGVQLMMQMLWALFLQI